MRGATRLEARPLDALNDGALLGQVALIINATSAGLADELVAQASTKDGHKWVSAVVTTECPDSLRSLGSQVLNKLGEGVVTLGAAYLTLRDRDITEG